MPEAQALATLRRDIDRRPHKIKRVLVDAGLRKHFFGGIADDERKAVKAFIGQNAENALKTKPKVNRRVSFGSVNDLRGAIRPTNKPCVSHHSW